MKDKCEQHQQDLKEVFAPMHARAAKEIPATQTSNHISGQYVPVAQLETLERASEKYRKALQFIKELSGECLENGDVRVGQAAEVAMRHIYRRANEALHGN
jgi:hypothetical protein